MEEQAPVVRQFVYRGYTITATLGDEGWTHTVMGDPDRRAFGSSVPLKLNESIDDAKALIDDLIEHPERYDGETPEDDDMPGCSLHRDIPHIGCPSCPADDWDDDDD